MIYINYVVLHTLMLHAKFQGNWPSGFGEEDFLRFWAFWDCKIRCFKLMWYSDYHIWRKMFSEICIRRNDKNRGDPNIWTGLVLEDIQGRELTAVCHWPSGFGEKDFLRFWAFWARGPSWSCDLDHLYKLLFPHPKEAPHKSWLWLVKRFQRRRLLKMWTDGRRTPDHGYTISFTLWAWRLRWAKNPQKHW